MASLMYGAGLRLMESLWLRVQDLDFSRNEILVRNGKGAKDRITMLPESFKVRLQEHLKRVKVIHDKNLADGWGRVLMPGALGRKYPNANRERRWQWVFPQGNRWRNTKTGLQGRNLVDESLVQKAVREAVIRAGVTKRATCRTFRHYFAINLLERGLSFRHIQALLGHNSSATTDFSYW